MKLNKLDLILKEGDIICNKCKGKKVTSRNERIFILCSKCKGAGKLDWIEQLAGKKDPYNVLIEKRNLSRQNEINLF